MVLLQTYILEQYVGVCIHLKQARDDFEHEIDIQNHKTTRYLCIRQTIFYWLTKTIQYNDNA